MLGHRWRSQFRSDKLFTEIKFVLEQFAAPYMELFKTTDALIDANKDNADALKVLFNSLFLLTKIFYSLNFQDLPEFFEDNMQTFLSLLHKYLTYTNPLLVTEGDDEAGLIEKVRASICEILELYTQRYEDVFSQYLPPFVETVWGMLTSIGPQTKYDVLVSRAVSFLGTVVKLPRYRGLFVAGDTMKQICENIILPNMVLRESDEELFEDDPIQFVRRDLEGSEVDTRRKASSEFVRALLEQFGSEVTQLMSAYVFQALERYAADPAANWKDKDAAVFMVMSVATKSSTLQHGVTQTNELVDIVDFCGSHIIPHLQEPVDRGHPMLKMDAIKYILLFRNQLTRDHLVAIFPLLAQHMGAANYAVYTYTAVCLERILCLKRDGAALFTPTDVGPVVYELLSNLLSRIESATTPEKLAENDFLMKCVMRVVLSAREEIVPYVDVILTKLVAFIQTVAKNPSNPRFNHFLFESVGGSMRFVCMSNPQAVQQFEAKLFPPFELILQQDVVEFVPYVFQIISQMLEFHAGRGLGDAYKALLPPLLQPPLWQSQGNVPALVRLIKAYIRCDIAYLVSSQQIEPVLGVFQKLIASKMNDHHGFDLLLTIAVSLDLPTLNNYLGPILNVLLSRLQRTKTSKYTRGFILFLAQLACLQKERPMGDVMLEVFEAVQPNLFDDVVQSVVVPDMAVANTPQNSRMVLIGMTRLLVQSPVFSHDSHLAAWTSLFITLAGLIVSPPVVVDATQDDTDDQDMDDAQYQAVFARLTAAPPPRLDITPYAPPDTRAYVSETLAQWLQANPVKATALQQQMPAELRAQLPMLFP